MKLYEYIYGLFDKSDYSFITGSYPIRIGHHVYPLDCQDVMRLSKHQCDLFPELSTIYASIDKATDGSGDVVPCIKSLLINENYFTEYINKLLRTNDSLVQKLHSLTTRYTCIRIRIDHETNADPFDYMNSVRNVDGIDQARMALLLAVREFHNFHILTMAPYVYVTDVHCRNIDGMFAYFADDTGKVLTEVRPILSFWTPKEPPNAAKEAEDFFRRGGDIPIEDLSLSRALVYEECRHFSLAIIHAVIALEVVVPAFTNKFFALNGVSKSAIEDFNNKFGLSVRVKALLKTILPKTTHPIIDAAGQAISQRNKILHKGISESSLNSGDIHKMIYACKKLVEIIRKESEKELSKKERN